MDGSFPSEKILESNLKYFEIHAAQRLTVFNFYVVISGTVLTAMAAISQGPSRYALAGSILGLLLTVISCVFYKLDVRTAFLVKHAEKVIKKIESDYLPKELSVFELEESSTRTAQSGSNFPCKMYTYGQLFRTLFCIFGLIGVTGFVILGLRALSVLDWTEPKDKPTEVTVVLRPANAIVPPASDANISARTDAGGPPRLSNDIGKMASQTDPSGKDKTGSYRQPR